MEKDGQAHHHRLQNRPGKQSVPAGIPLPPAIVCICRRCRIHPAETRCFSSPLVFPSGTGRPCQPDLNQEKRTANTSPSVLAVLFSCITPSSVPESKVFFYYKTAESDCADDLR
jgi:hypothetical protein